LSSDVTELVEKAKALYQRKLVPFVGDHKPPAFIAKAPGRVNLIGEHTDYNDGYVLPLAIDRCTVAYGTGFLRTGKGSMATKISLRVVSADAADDVVEERKLVAGGAEAPDESEPRTWVSYVVGTVAQYLPDLPHEGCVVDLAVAFASDIPLGAGLSSSAALEVATAAFVESFMHEHAYVSSDDPAMDRRVQRAMRCQKAENDWANSPCGIMDQIASSCAVAGSLMLIDCQTLEVTQVEMKKDVVDEPVILVVDSKVEHEIADSEYGKRRAECHDALEAMQQVPLYHVMSLRDATLQDVETAKSKMDDVSFRRARHVVTENSRTRECKTALKLGLWTRVGELMNASHKSLQEDFQVSCEEVDLLVDAAQKHPGVFGSRMTGGGFGGCLVTLVKKENMEDLVSKLKALYKEVLSKECDCFVVNPAEGAKVVAIDMECKKH
jgi:galactokinase